MEGLSEQERAAVGERAAKRRMGPARGRGGRAAADERAVLDTIARMVPKDRAMAERIHELVTSAAPELSARLWYGQPAYARKGKVVCFFRSGHDDEERYSTLGFTPEARLDEGGLWPTSYAVAELDADAERTITRLVTKALG